MKQAFNPYLPLDVYIPDGEPHVFGDRVYLFGSHDKEAGDKFCMLDYEVFSAPVDDLTDWTSKGINYRADQDPSYSEMYKYMYAPDVVQGNDGKFYLYYSLSGESFTGPLRVAVCDTPDGAYEYYGTVQNSDGTVFNRNITFDPGMINDDGVIRMYYGWALAKETAEEDAEQPELPEEMKAIFTGTNEAEQMKFVEMHLFNKTMEEIDREPEGIQGANTIVLADDMITVVGEPKRIAPGQFAAAGTNFEGHAFFEASSMRKINGTYYFIYSSERSHDLCYATSKYPDRDFVYRGVIISNGDIDIDGRLPKDRLATSGNNHGSIEYINGQWYVFYHRQTHKTSFSRQGCAEKITILEDGSIPQVEMTSCGLCSQALKTEGTYPAVIACNLTNGRMPHITPQGSKQDIPYVTSNGNERFIKDINYGTLIGYKYFDFSGQSDLIVTLKGSATGILYVYTDKTLVGEIPVSPEKKWMERRISIKSHGVKSLCFKYEGTGKLQFLEFGFEK